MVWSKHTPNHCCKKRKKCYHMRSTNCLFFSWLKFHKIVQSNCTIRRNLIKKEKNIFKDKQYAGQLFFSFCNSHMKETQLRVYESRFWCIVNAMGQRDKKHSLEKSWLWLVVMHDQWQVNDANPGQAWSQTNRNSTHRK